MEQPERSLKDLSDEELIQLARAKAREVAEKGQYLTSEVSRDKQAGPVGELLAEPSQAETNGDD